MSRRKRRAMAVAVDSSTQRCVSRRPWRRKRTTERAAKGM
jgi:hypothetical protein